MQSTAEFNGLGMPVFMAFGWAGEETAQKYALEQLELFAAALQSNLPKLLRNELPVSGLSQETQGSYLAADENVEENIYIAFYARPKSLEIILGLSNKALLAKGLKRIEKDPVAFHRLLKNLGPDWNLHIQQIHINEETGEQSPYQDVYKDSINALDEETAVEIINKTIYLNGEAKWVTPIFIYQRLPSEQAANMGKAIIPVMTERLDLLTPLVFLLTGRSSRKAESSLKIKQPAKTKRKAKKSQAPLPEKTAGTSTAPRTQEFTYETELKPLHLRKGFINMTPHHWPFFQLTARSETRAITLLGEGIRDTNSSVWRLQPNNLARLVLSPQAHTWLEDNFVAGDVVQLTATKMSDKEIQIIVEMTE